MIVVHLHLLIQIQEQLFKIERHKIKLKTHKIKRSQCKTLQKLFLDKNIDLEKSQSHSSE